jgi:ABC-2 type transport system permease protein
MTEAVARPRTEIPLIRILRRTVVAYAALASISLKSYLVYVFANWLEFGLQFLWMVAFVYFWRAVYAGRPIIAGLELQQTLDYAILSMALMPLVERDLILEFGWMLREGYLAVELLRPVDFQARSYVSQLADLFSALIQKIPLLIFAWLLFGLRLPSNPVVWLVFVVSLLLGHAVIFCFEWAFACLAFYTTETMGLWQSRVGLARLFSGALVPLAMMPGWLLTICQSLPFAQVVFVPVTLLTGITPVSEAPRVWGIQILWLIGLISFSRLVFRFTVRQVTIQGG